MTELAAAPITLTLSLSAETAYTDTRDMLVRISNDFDVSQAFWRKSPTVDVTLPFHNGPGDAYRIVVHVNGFENAGAFAHADPTAHKTLNLLMIPSPAMLGFPSWDQLNRTLPQTAALIAAGVSAAEAEARYTALAKDRPLALASLMNLCAAMTTIGLGGGTTPLSFIKQVIWDSTLAQDRFFAWTDPQIVPLVRAAALEGEFAEELNPQLLHPGATSSFKQTQFDYADVQLTFHENDHQTIDQVACIRMEPDIDLYKEVFAHGIGELLPNLLTGGLTNPLAVLALRWMDAVQNNEPLFHPGYTLS